MAARSRSLTIGIPLLAGVVLLPLAGAIASGRRIEPLLRFPPRLELPLGLPGWSWFAALGVAGALCAFALPFFAAWKRSPLSAPKPAEPATSRTLPVWGWAAVIWTVLWWVLAWTRPPIIGELARHTFFPLWLGLIVLVNALTQKRTGTCLLVREPARWIGLFVASSAFWWLFEWLNRYVQNWHYLGVEDYGALPYFLNGTLCFSTVLPAVSAFAEWLQSSPDWNRRWKRGPRWSFLLRQDAALAIAILSSAALFLTGIKPDQLFPALWAAPLLLAISVGVLSRQQGLWTEIARGDWSRAAAWALAALLCGFFWELWNWQSYPKWIYTIPYFDRFRLFEMPIPGYAGYLPFGLECLVVCDWLFGRRIPTEKKLP